jgi:hypothetical protein
VASKRALFARLSLHQKIPFPRSGGDWFDDCVLGPEFGGKRPAFRLFGIEPKRLELPAPIGRWIAEPLDADAAGKAAFHGCFDKIGC